jgi:formate dehydrogenase iron-sulfur subunit
MTRTIGDRRKAGRTVEVAILNDITKCIGCGACALACQEINGLPKQENPPVLSDVAWTRVEKTSKGNVRQQCMHCLDPTCVSVCPVRALQKTPEGPVIYEESRCIGCRYCMMACPFDIPKYEWEKTLPKIDKCIMCYDKRVKKGLQPACTTVCPTGATHFGDRDELIEIAKARIAQNPERYVDHIYGLKEAGGTSVLYLSPVPFSELGFKHLLEDPYPKLTWDILSKVPDIVSIGGVLLFGTYWVIKRRMRIERLDFAEAGEGRIDSEEGEVEK